MFGPFFPGCALARATLGFGVVPLRGTYWSTPFSYHRVEDKFTSATTPHFAANPGSVARVGVRGVLSCTSTPLSPTK